MEKQGTDGPGRPHSSPDGPDDQGQNIVRDPADAGQREAAASPVSAPARRQEGGLTHDGQLAEPGYGHGV